MTTIQPATIDLLPQIVDLAPRIFANAARGLAPIDMGAWAFEAQRFIDAPDRRIFVALEHGRIAGLHAVAATPVIFAPSVRVAHTITNWVSPAHRGQGVGAKLQEAVEAWARSVGARTMLAGVPVDYTAHAAIGDVSAGTERAEAFYRGRGYAFAEAMFIKEIR